MKNPYLVRLKRQFIIVMMSIVIVFLLAIFGIQYISASHAFEENSRRILESSIRIERERKQDDQENAPPIFDTFMKDDFGTLRTPVLMVRYEDSSDMLCLTIVRNNLFYIENEEISTITETVLSKQDGIGLLESYSLKYIKETDEKGVVRMAFVDISNDIAQLQQLFKRSLLISGGVILVMLVLSFILAKITVRPVEKAWEEQKRFVADASHELKTPLTVILSNTDMIINSQDQQSQKNQRRLDNIKNESSRMKELVMELLEVARGDMEERNVVKQEVNLSELVDDICLTWEPVLYENSRTLDSEIDENCLMLGDREKLSRLIVILLDNAMKYSKEHSQIKVSLKLNHKSRSYQLAVTDVGEYMSEEERKAVFDRFYRADKSREEIPGYGLGLAIAHRIVADHGGRIWVESEKREDSSADNTFYVRFTEDKKVNKDEVFFS